MTCVKCHSPDDAAYSVLENEVHRREKTIFLQYLEEKRVPRQTRFPQVGEILVDDRSYILGVKRIVVHAIRR